jgi:ArsR family transcriptional regulator
MQRCCPPAVLHPADLSREAATMRALSDPHRLSILATLARAEDEVCVCDFTAGLPLNQPTVSHHLRVLKDAGLIAGTRRGTWVYYRLADAARERIAAALEAILPERALVP